MLDTHEIDPLILIPTAIHDFLCVHPFNDGNGRMSHLLTTLLRAVEGKLGKFTKTDILELCPTLGKTSVESSLKKLLD